MPESSRPNSAVSTTTRPIFRLVRGRSLLLEPSRHFDPHLRSDSGVITTRVKIDTAGDLRSKGGKSFSSRPQAFKNLKSGLLLTIKNHHHILPSQTIYVELRISRMPTHKLSEDFQCLIATIFLEISFSQSLPKDSQAKISTGSAPKVDHIIISIAPVSEAGTIPTR